NMSPAHYAKLSPSPMQRGGALELLRGSAPHPVAPPSHTGSNEERILLQTGGKFALRASARNSWLLGAVLVAGVTISEIWPIYWGSCIGFRNPMQRMSQLPHTALGKLVAEEGLEPPTRGL